MKRLLFISFVCFSFANVWSQDMANSLIEKAVKNGIVLLRQDYQILNEDDEPIGNKEGLNCYGRTYTCGIRVNEDEFLVTKDFITPWMNESIVKSDKRHPEVSYSGFLALNTIDFEQIDCDVENAEEEIANHLYRIGASEIEGFSLDEDYGRKKGYAVWLKSTNEFNLELIPSGLTIEIIPFNITTNEKVFVYEIPQQPKGNVVGGAFLVPNTNKIGSIILKVNGMFEKKGGIWKLISIGKNENLE